MSEIQLRNIFLEADDILAVYIRSPVISDSKYTYGFVKFSNSKDAMNACTLFNNKNIDGLLIKVTLSFKTQERLLNKETVRLRDDSFSILRKSLPRVEFRNTESKGKQSQHFFQENLKGLNDFNNVNTKWLGIKSQNDVEDLMKTFKNALADMREIPEVVGCDLIKHKPEKVDI